MHDSTINLYSVYHKSFYLPKAEYVIPIHAGKITSQENLGIAGDDTGDNISGLNQRFCELTALYWIWKNKSFKENDYWGLCHYRRYFSIPFSNPFISKSKALTKTPSQENIDKLLNEKLKNYILKTLETNDVIVQKPKFAYKRKGITLNIEDHYCKDHHAQDWYKMKEVVHTLYPEYDNSMKTFCNMKMMSFANMMIAKPAVWDEYLNWIFPIMFELNEKIPYHQDPYQSRVLGFISERLLNLFLLHKSYKTSYMFITSFNGL